MTNLLIDEKILKLSTFNKVIETITESEYTQKTEYITNISNHFDVISVFNILDKIKNNSIQVPIIPKVYTSPPREKENLEDEYIIISLIKSKDYDKLLIVYDLIIIENLEIKLLLISKNKQLIISIDNKIVKDEKEIYSLFADKLNEISYSTLCRLFKFINTKTKDKPKNGKQKRKDLENNIHKFFMDII